MADAASLNDGSLDGRVALVTGGSRGIGRALALALARHGADVAITYVSQPKGAEETAAGVRAAGRRCHVAACDVADGAAVVAMVQAVAEAIGPPDILVNNAGITRDTLLMRMKDEDWDTVVATDLRGAFVTTRACLRGMMKSRWGRIINIGSVVAAMGNPGQANYAAAKAGLGGFTRSIAREVGSRNITANLIAPGFIETDITADLPDDLVARVRAQIPLQRLGTPEDVAPLVVFLASESGRYITGQTINVDGGLLTT